LNTRPPGELPVAAHIVREWLPPTQTFVVNQVTHLARYRPVAVCHHRTGEPLGVVEPWSAHDHAPRALRCADVVTDRTFRTPVAPVSKAMADFVSGSGARVLHYHFLVNARSYLGLIRRTRVPALVSGYGYDVSSFPRRLHGLGKRYLRPVFAEVDMFLAMSEDMRTDLCELGCPEDRIRVHYHGIDTERFACPGRSYGADTGVTVLSVGRLTEVKGQDRLIDAAALVRRRTKVPFRVVLVGDGPLRPRIEERIRQARMGDHVTVVGHVQHQSDGLVAHYRAADLFVLPSATAGDRKEGIPGSLVEAMAAGLPVVSTRHAGIPSVVDDGAEGVLVDEGPLARGDIGALADAIEALVVDAGLRARLGVAAADRARRDFDVGAATSRLEVLYDDLSSSGSVRGA
jgi:colanic acid/amylovoran biosynthesis glycosyltransferase